MLLGSSKGFNLRNLRRLIEKSYRKYVLKKHQEFGHISQYVLIHLRQLINSLLLNKYIDLSDLDTNTKFLYFPLHVPGDAALTLRSPEYLDQLSLLDYIAGTFPLRWFFA